MNVPIGIEKRSTGLLLLKMDEKIQDLSEDAYVEYLERGKSNWNFKSSNILLADRFA